MAPAAPSDAVAVASRRFRLRDATRAEHARLDAFISTAGFLTSRSRYAVYLSATLAARDAIERGLEESTVSEVYPEWRHRLIAACLRQDIVDLGGPAPRLAAPAFPLADRAEILGALYVLEGSSLGARLLQRDASALGLTSELGARHMAAQVADGRAWPRFTALLDAEAFDHAEEVACLAAAKRVFEHFEQSYRQALQPA
jgi:heme oxygenase